MIPSPFLADQRLVGVVGDAHGNLEFLAAAVTWCAERGAKVVVQLGDLGAYWVRGEAAATWFDDLDAILATADVTLVFVDGNHEGWEALAEWRYCDPEPGDPTSSHRLSKRVWWADRTCRWEWAGRRFAAFGGAFSIDARTRTIGVSWFPELEEPTEADMYQVLAAAPMDVLLSHDAPHTVGLEGVRLPPTIAARADDTPVMLDRIVDRHRPTLVLHGHWHHAHRSRSRIATGVRVVGLGRDGTSIARSVGVLDVADLSFTFAGEHDEAHLT